MKKSVPHLTFAGFTLIELSIVLVIIALIIGGVMAGQDLIKAAQMKAAVSQMEKYETAANTFRSKYNCLPGDCTPTQAQQFGFFPRSGQVGDGDGDGIIAANIGIGVASATQIWGEPLLFWSDLSSANLISESFTNPCTMTSFLFCSVNAWSPTPAQIATEMPFSKLGNNNFVLVYGGVESWDAPLVSTGFYHLSGHNYFEITGVISLSQFPTLASAMTPLDAYAIDAKIDDGLPTTGIVVAMSANGLAIPSPPFSPNCVNTATVPFTYALSGSNSTTPNCAVQKQTGF